jgi:hypothetical protein
MIRPGDLAHALDQVEFSDAARVALTDVAERIAASVRDALSHPPGSGHDVPWERSGDLRSSIGVDATSDNAVIGSTSPVAVYQELGTHTDPPRPFLAPVAMAMAEDTATAIGAAMAETLAAALGARVCGR